MPRINQGDLAAITTTGKILPLSADSLGSPPAYEQRLAAEGFPLPSATEARDSALTIHEGKQEAQGERQQAWEAQPIDWAAPGQGGEPTGGLGPGANPGGIARGGATRAAEAALDAVTGIFENIFSPEPPKPEKVKQQERAQQQQRAATHDQAAKTRLETTRKSARSKPCFKATAFMMKPSPPKSTNDGRG